MLFSQLINQQLLVSNSPKGIIKGVGISLKTYKVKYLLCAKSHTDTLPLFVLSMDAVVSLAPDVSLSHLRPVLPRQCACLFTRLPIYSFEGVHLGFLQDCHIDKQIVTAIQTDKGMHIPVTSIAACADAILLKKKQPYPLGQRIPTPVLPILTDKKEGLVTKPLLRSAIENKALIKLTLSLPPFDVEAL